jgi:cytochrome c556
MSPVPILLILALVFAGGAAASPVEEDPRIPVTLPPEMRPAFLQHMRDHMDSLDDVMAELGKGDFKGAARAAREELVPGSGAGFGRHLPLEFREMGLAMHRAAATFADVADAVPADPTAAHWQKTMEALQGISTHCRACHATYRVE